jgi:hypothetical protein
MVCEMRQGWSERSMRADMEATGKRASQYKWQMLTPCWDEDSRDELLHRQPDSATYLLSLDELELASPTSTGSMPGAPTLDCLTPPKLDSEEDDE